MDKKIKIFITIIAIVPIMLISTLMYYEQSEKGLDDVISINSSNFDYLEINNDLRVDNKGYAEGLREFLSQYKVKKMSDDWWDYNLSKGKGLEISIYSKGKALSAIILENRVAIYNDGDVYKIVNGPIDMDWVDKMYELYK